MKMKKRLVILVLLAVQSFLTYGQDSIFVKTESFSAPCYGFKNMKGGILKSQADIDSLTWRNESMSCNVDFPKIDFASKCLIWIKFGTSGCSAPDISCELYKIPKDRIYVLSITVNEKGYCKPLRISTIQAVAPKFEEGYNFKYEIKTNKTGN